MKRGDLVRLVGNQTIQQVWLVTDIKSYANGIWIQIYDNCRVPNVWHAASNYEVINGNR